MGKFLVVEEGRRSFFYNFGILFGSDKKEVKDKYANKMDVDEPDSDLTVINIDDIDEDYYHYLEIDFKNLEP